MVAALELSRSIALEDRPKLPDTPITELARHEYALAIAGGTLRVSYNPDGVTFFQRDPLLYQLNGRTRFNAIDLEYGTTSGAPFGRALSPDLVSLLRSESERIKEEVTKNPSALLFITPETEASFIEAQDKGKIRTAITHKGPAFYRKITQNGKPTEFAEVDVQNGIIKGTPSYPDEQPLTQAWWELYKREEARLVTF